MGVQDFMNTDSDSPDIRICSPNRLGDPVILAFHGRIWIDQIFHFGLSLCL